MRCLQVNSVYTDKTRPICLNLGVQALQLSHLSCEVNAFHLYIKKWFLFSVNFSHTPKYRFQLFHGFLPPIIPKTTKLQVCDLQSKLP